jgi:hypothetical protein
MKRIVAFIVLLLLGLAALPASAREGQRPPEGRSYDEVLIIGRAARLPEITALATSAGGCGVTPIAETLEDIRGWWPGEPDTAAIQLEVAWWFSGTDLRYKNVLLFGAWTGQASYPEYREIPARLVYVGDLAPGGWTVSDQPYGDIHRDGHWDVPVFRLITRSSAETNMYCQKIAAYYNTPHNQDWQRSVAIQSDDMDTDVASPDIARELSLQLSACVGGNFIPDPVILAADHDGPDQTFNRAVLPNALSAGKAVIVAGPSSGSSSVNWLCFAPIAWHFAEGAANSMWPLMLGGSCDMARFQLYINHADDSCPFTRDYLHVTDYRQGPISWMGPTCGTHQQINFWVLQQLLPALMVYGCDFGHALVYATNMVYAGHEEARESLLSYAGVGVPWLKLHRTSGTLPSSVAERSSPPPLRLAVAPNPVHADRSVQISLSNAPGPISGALIVDPGGRVVRSFTALGPGPLSWDLRDNAGRQISSGIYFLRVPGNGTTGKSIVVVR